MIAGPTQTTSFTAYKYIKSAAQAERWISAITAAEGTLDFIRYPDDVAEGLASFAAMGVSTTPSQVQSVFDVYAAKDCAGWVGISEDAVAGLDWIVEEILEGSNPNMPLHIAVLRSYGSST